MKLNVVHDDEVVEMGGEAGNLRTIRLQQDVIGEAVNGCIAKDSALGVEQKAVVPVIIFERLYGVRDHSVEPAEPIASGNLEKGQIAKIVNTGKGAQSSELPVWIRKPFGRERAPVLRKGQSWITSKQVRDQGRLNDRRRSCGNDLGRGTHGKDSVKIIAS